MECAIAFPQIPDAVEGIDIRKQVQVNFQPFPNPLYDPNNIM